MLNETFSVILKHRFSHVKSIEILRAKQVTARGPNLGAEAMKHELNKNG